MKFSYILIFLIVSSCVSSINSLNKKNNLHSSRGFAMIYNEDDFINNIVSKKIKQDEIIIAHDSLRVGTLLKITNPENKISILAKNTKKVRYPDFYKVLISEQTANKLKLNTAIPYIELEEVRRNKSFIAKKAKMFNEEKNIHNKAPVEMIKIDNISVNNPQKNIKIKKFYLIIGEFYTKKSVLDLKEVLLKESIILNKNKLILKVRQKNKIQLLSGPYIAINSLKNDYIKLKQFGFEDIDIKLYE